MVLGPEETALTNTPPVLRRPSRRVTLVFIGDGKRVAEAKFIPPTDVSRT